MLVKARKSATLILENCNYYDIPEDIMNLVESISNSNVLKSIDIRLPSYTIYREEDIDLTDPYHDFMKKYLSGMKLKVTVKNDHSKSDTQNPAKSDINLIGLRHFPNLKRICLLVDTDDYSKFKGSIFLISSSIRCLQLESNDKFNFYSSYFRTQIFCMNLLSTCSEDYWEP
ncbi:unnamed protein product [Ambrosiozyma monospora]|uniref:Unnamed protein product n=1 Tax=Ambrosiozyma monospora TaxID=43982 RepID=A0ACB5TF64_AMBMO|nr:unnamed protein product [Ambrosiozyma monospora]